MADIKSIKKHLSFHTQTSVQQRGKVLYNEDKVSLVNSVKEDDVINWDFQVQGSKLYDVQIIETDDNILALCSCPYNWGPTCKHTVASLLHIIDAKSSKLPRTIEEPENSRATSQPYILTDYKNITDEVLKENTADNIYRYLDYFRSINLLSAEIKARSIVFTIDYDYARYRVVFEYFDNKLSISSSERSQALKLKRSEALCLKLISKSKSPDLLDIIFSEKLDDFKQKIATDYGIKSKYEFDLNFKLEFKEYDGLVASLLDNNSGLLPVENNDQIVNFLGKNLSNSTFIVPNAGSKKEKRTIAFVINPSYFKNQRYSNLITPFIEKLHKR